MAYVRQMMVWLNSSVGSRFTRLTKPFSNPPMSSLKIMWQTDTLRPTESPREVKEIHCRSPLNISPMPYRILEAEAAVRFPLKQRPFALR